MYLLPQASAAELIPEITKHPRYALLDFGAMASLITASTLEQLTDETQNNSEFTIAMLINASRMALGKTELLGILITKAHRPNGKRFHIIKRDLPKDAKLCTNSWPDLQYENVPQRDSLPFSEDEFPNQSREASSSTADDDILLMARSVVARAKAVLIIEPVVFDTRCNLVDYSSVQAGSAVAEPSDGSFRLLSENHEGYQLYAGT